ncbi:hypothetical protein MTR67_039638 [Solanum verrucosum]|uniref:HotDog ACOT-type domain-containing protein n=1 Tax=Solanum verrucosum TaxID=315347 RepID=A0AAF0UH88_SOLVR|nr:hypothetical protein MTR67_039638 [Solanum verrucosum]
MGMVGLAPTPEYPSYNTSIPNSCYPRPKLVHGRLFFPPALDYLLARQFKMQELLLVPPALHTSVCEHVKDEILLKGNARSVDVGDFLRFKSCVLYTEHENTDQPLINVEVVAHVTRPEQRSSEVSNRFYFTFTVRPEAKATNIQFRIRKVVPATEEEARRVLERMDADYLQSI